jgi:hypothetical protein
MENGGIRCLQICFQRSFLSLIPLSRGLISSISARSRWSLVVVACLGIFYKGGNQNDRLYLFYCSALPLCFAFFAFNNA